MKIIGSISFVLFSWYLCWGQSTLVGGRCEGCEAIDEYGDKKLTWTDTLPDFNIPGPKMVIFGTVFKKDGKTPAPGVILYIYHTDQSGVYAKKGDETGWAKRHGYIRGWIKTSQIGEYRFYTNRPAAYPNRSAPEHIHITVKEPEINEYWIDSFNFDGDPLLTQSARDNKQKRGGSGIIELKSNAQGLLECKRDIILGFNIPNYP